jgi:hypothetical protein
MDLNAGGSEVIEIKRTLDGMEHTFRCALLGQSAGWAALRFISDRRARVGGLELPAGTETVAHYWVDRPYTAYHWRDSQGQTLGIYLNAASDVEIRQGAIRWQDLALDVLVTGGRIEIVDEDEARAAPTWAQEPIARARAELLSHAEAIAAEVSDLTDRVTSAGAASHLVHQTINRRKPS